MLERDVGVTERPRPLNPSKAITMAICPIIIIYFILFYYLECALVHDVACEFACAVRNDKREYSYADHFPCGLSLHSAR